MRRRFIALLALTVSFAAQAQWGGFLDPDIMRQAGENAANGNIELGNMEMDNTQIGPASRGPSAAEIATEIRRQEQREKNEAAWRRREELSSQIRAGIRQAYEADFGR